MEKALKVEQISTFYITHELITIHVPIDTIATWLQRRFNVEGVLGVILPNGTEIDLISTTNLQARKSLSGQQTVLVLSSKPSTSSQNSQTISFTTPVCSFGCNTATLCNGCVVWGVDRFPFDHQKFSKSNDNTAITVHDAGLYRMDLKLLNTTGSALHPYIEIDGVVEMYCYTSTTGYGDASANIVVPLVKNSVVRVKFQSSSGNMYSGTNKEYSRFSITKIQ